MKNIVLSLFIFFLGYSLAYSQTSVSATLDTNFIRIGEPVKLTLRANYRLDEGAINLSFPTYSDTIISGIEILNCLLYTSPSPRDRTRSRMPSSA